jgi:hypothetical protein
MKDWFPLTNYDFYAYLTTGMVVLAAYDRGFMSSVLAHEQHWTIVNGVFWAAVAYLIGQIIAMPSAALFEQWLARRVFHSPTEILLGLKTPRLRERAVAIATGAREYDAFPSANRTSIVTKLAKALKVDASALEGEAAFQCAFPHARSVPDSASRLDSFLNQYGMCRNVSFAALVAAILLWVSAWRTHDPNSIKLAFGTMVLSLGLFFRFLKFYAAYAREVFRTYDKSST